MYKRIVGLCALFFFFFTSRSLASQIEKVQIEDTNSIYNNIDSIQIEYWNPSEGDTYYFTLKQNQLMIIKENAVQEIKINDEKLLKRINEFLDLLFVSGKEKTEIGRTYRTKLIFSEEPEIKISIFEKDKTIITHKIYLSMETCDIEFSKAFVNFHRLLKEL